MPAWSPSPAGIRVPHGGSSCAGCMYVVRDGTGRPGPFCVNPGYIMITYKGKRAGDDRFIDGKTGQVVSNPLDFCCNLFDW